MITKFKIYESISQLPEKLDWVIVEPSPNLGLKDNESFGQILRIYNDDMYSIYFDTTRTEKTLKSNHLKYWSKSKEELELFAASKKYNL